MSKKTKKKAAPKPRNISLSHSQMSALLYSSIRNIVDLQLECGNDDNQFLVNLILECIIDEAFPNKDVEDIENGEDYETKDFFVSHAVEPLSEFSSGIFRVKNDETKEKFWGTQIYIDKNNIADFLDALFEVECMWMDSDESDEEIKKPSKDSMVFEGNGTMN